MVLTKEQSEDLEEAARPLIKYLNNPEVFHPHIQVIVENNSVKLFELSVSRIIEDFLVD